MADIVEPCIKVAVGLNYSSSFSALTLLVGSFDPYKPVPDMTYNVLDGMLKLNQLININNSTVVFSRHTLLTDGFRSCRCEYVNVCCE